MTERVFIIDVRGKKREWSFIFVGDESALEDWLEDGLSVSVVENIIPQWWTNLGFSSKVWGFFQDILRRW